MFYEHSERSGKEKSISTADNRGLLTAEVSKCMFIVKPQIRVVYSSAEMYTIKARISKAESCTVSQLGLSVSGLFLFFFLKRGRTCCPVRSGWKHLARDSPSVRNSSVVMLPLPRARAP